MIEIHSFLYLTERHEVTDTPHLEEICVSNSKPLPARATASQCVKAETVTPETDTRSKRFPSLTLLAAKKTQPYYR